MKTNLETRVRMLAKTDSTVKHFVDAYDRGEYYTSFEDMLVDLLQAMVDEKLNG